MQCRGGRKRSSLDYFFESKKHCCHQKLLHCQVPLKVKSPRAIFESKINTIVNNNYYYFIVNVVYEGLHVFFYNTTKTIANSFIKGRRQARLLKRLCVWNLGWISIFMSSLNAPKNRKNIAKIFLMVFFILMNQGPLGVHYFSNMTFSITSTSSSTTIDAFQNFTFFCHCPWKLNLQSWFLQILHLGAHCHHQKLIIQDVSIIVSQTKIFDHHSFLRMVLS